MAGLGKQLALGLQPVGVGVARQIESPPTLGNKIGARLDLRVRWIERSCRYGRRLHFNLFPSLLVLRRGFRLRGFRPSG